MFRCEFAVLLLGRYHLTNYHLVSFEGDSPILQNKEVRSQTIKKVIVASCLDCLTLIPVTRRIPICSDKTIYNQKWQYFFVLPTYFVVWEFDFTKFSKDQENYKKQNSWNFSPKLWKTIISNAITIKIFVKSTIYT